MYICPNCNHTSETPANFCAVCGAKMVESNPAPAVEQPVVEQPVVEQPVVEQPIYPYYNIPQQPMYNPAPVGPSKAKMITGMALSIAGFAFAIIGLLYTVLFSIIEGEAGFALSITFGIISTPLSIVGLVLSKSCINAGGTAIFCRLGKIFGLIGVILSGVSLFIGLIAFVFDPGISDFDYDYYNDDYYDYI